MASLYLAKGDEEAVSKVVMKALQVAPDDADTVLNGAALMWETQFRRVDMAWSRAALFLFRKRRAAG